MPYKNATETIYTFYCIIKKPMPNRFYDSNDEMYIGVTTKNIKQRFSQHKSDFRRGKFNTMSYQIFEKYGIDNCDIGFFIKLKNITQQEAHEIESMFIYMFNCVNKNKGIKPKCMSCYENTSYLKYITFFNAKTVHITYDENDIGTCVSI